MELDANPSKIRSGLIYVSMAIILWNIAGGSFNNELGLLGGSIKFERIEYLEYSGVAIYLYLLFRYGLLFKHSNAEFQTIVIFELASDINFMRFSQDVIVATSNNDIKERCKQRVGRPWKNYLSRLYEGNISELKLLVPLSLDRLIFPKKVFFMSSETEQEVKLINKFRYTQEEKSFYKLNIRQRVRAQYYISTAIVRTLWRSQVFYEVIFPVIFALIAYLILGWKLLKYF